MKIKALRGVCIGVESHLTPGDVADVDPATAQFLVTTGAVERVIDPPPAAPDPESAEQPAPDPADEKPRKSRK